MCSQTHCSLSIRWRNDYIREINEISLKSNFYIILLLSFFSYSMYILYISEKIAFSYGFIFSCIIIVSLRPMYVLSILYTLSYLNWPQLKEHEDNRPYRTKGGKTSTTGSNGQEKTVKQQNKNKRQITDKNIALHNICNVLSWQEVTVITVTRLWISL